MRVIRDAKANDELHVPTTLFVFGVGLVHVLSKMTWRKIMDFPVELKKRSKANAVCAFRGFKKGEFGEIHH
jgi:hypothetical protein